MPFLWQLLSSFLRGMVKDANIVVPQVHNIKKTLPREAFRVFCIPVADTCYKTQRGCIKQLHACCHKFYPTQRWCKILYLKQRFQPEISVACCVPILEFSSCIFLFSSTKSVCTMLNGQRTWGQCGDEYIIETPQQLNLKKKLKISVCNFYSKSHSSFLCVRYRIVTL